MLRHQKYITLENEKQIKSEHEKNLLPVRARGSKASNYINCLFIFHLV